MSSGEPDARTDSAPETSRNAIRGGVLRLPALGILLAILILQTACGGETSPGTNTLRKDTVVSNKPQQWRVLELQFTAEGTYVNPAADVALVTTFVGPEGETYAVSGFWDGGDAWKVRFTPTAPGKWTYVTQCSSEDPGLNGQTGTFRAARAAGSNPLLVHGGFLRVSDNRRYLTYTDGTPFFWLGDTWWFCPSALVPYEGSTNPEYDSMYRTLIDMRSEQGYTVAHMAFLGPISESRGVNSLADQGRTRSIDTLYWREVDRYIAYANESGIVPVIGLAFHSGMDELDLSAWTFLWQYVVARYGAFPVSWLIGGEYNADTGNPTERVPMVLALGQAIKDADPYRRAMTVHPWWYRGDGRQAWDEPWYDFIMLQGAHGAAPPLSLYHEAYARSDPKPVLEGECNYEGIHNLTDFDVRWAAYRAIQAGSFGYTYGAHGLWYPTQSHDDTTFDEWGTPVPWWEALRKPGGAQMRLLREFYESLAWWELEPRPDGLTSDPRMPDMVMPAVKALEDRTFVIYFPRNYPSTASAYLHGTRPGAAYQATWFDPRTGEWSLHEGDLTTEPTGMLLPSRPGYSMDWLLQVTLDSRDR